jgi:hypothetical protein
MIKNIYHEPTLTNTNKAEIARLRVREVRGKNIYLFSFAEVFRGKKGFIIMIIFSIMKGYLEMPSEWIGV